MRIWVPIALVALAFAGCDKKSNQSKSAPEEGDMSSDPGAMDRDGMKSDRGDVMAQLAAAQDRFAALTKQAGSWDAFKKSWPAAQKAQQALIEAQIAVWTKALTMGQDDLKKFFAAIEASDEKLARIRRAGREAMAKILSDPAHRAELMAMGKKMKDVFRPLAEQLEVVQGKVVARGSRLGVRPAIRAQDKLAEAQILLAKRPKWTACQKTEDCVSHRVASRCHRLADIAVAKSALAEVAKLFPLVPLPAACTKGPASFARVVLTCTSGKCALVRKRH